MNLRLKRTPGLYIVGFMGCGKSTVGRLLAQELGWHFIDLDERIEKLTGTTISALFEKEGEAAFRETESKELRSVVQAVERGFPSVVSLGGGAFVDEGNLALLKNNGITIWLDCPLDIVERRVGRQAHRPLARDPDRFRKLFAERKAFYEKAEYRVEVSDADAHVHAQAILRLPLFT